MKSEKPIFEDEDVDFITDPDETPIPDRRLVTQPYDLVITALMDQIKEKTLYLRPISQRPSFQRRYVWSDKLASRLIESILLNVPIPPCYLAQNEEFELDVIDGQQRIYSIYRFLNNQFELSELEVMTELNGSQFFKLPRKLQRKLETFTLRCIIITNDSNPEIRFDVFERLNSNTIPLNAQEIRNCVHRGSLIDLINRLVEHQPWLGILNRKQPDIRMRDEELILRFFSFQIQGIQSYKTPQKHWLNEMAKAGRRYNQERISELEFLWKETINKCLVVFGPEECFRRLPLENSRSVINRALMDLTMVSLALIPTQRVAEISEDFRTRYIEILHDDEFSDLITRAIDHRSRTTRRFEIWNSRINFGL